LHIAIIESRKRGQQPQELAQEQPPQKQPRPQQQQPQEQEQPQEQSQVPADELILYDSSTSPATTLTLNVAVSDVAQLAFNADAITAISGTWAWYTETGFQGTGSIINPSNPIPTPSVSIRSVRPAPFVGQIILYSELNYTGTSLVLYDAESNLVPHGFNDTAKSIRVPKGKWILYQNTGFGGQSVTVTGPSAHSPIPGITSQSLSSLQFVP
jgi:hypothetical protein